MESETLMYGCQSRKRVLTAFGPVLWIAISYVDSGKWAAALEGGSQLGLDLSYLLLILNCTAILCQYLSARVAIATGRNLAQICSEEYDDLSCLLLGLQVEISMVVLDLTMVLGTSHGLNAMFGINLLISVFFTCSGVVLLPLLTSSPARPKAKILSILLTSFLLSFYVAGFPISQPKISVSASRMLSKLTGENSYVLMGVLGANIMPHNFYLHSSIVQQDQGHPNVSAGDLCRYHFLATLFIFIGIFMVNFMLMYLGASVFYGSELVSLTLQDALSLSDQGFKSSLASTALIFIMFFSHQLVAVTWSNGNSWRFLQIGRLRRSTIKLIVIIPAFCCVLHSDAEDIFQLLIFTQVVVGLLLPSSVIPLFRVASSRSIMGAYRISQWVKFLTIFSFIGMLVLNIMFVNELAFGNSDWVFSLEWNIGSSVPIFYLILLITTLASICLPCWLAITPLKSTRFEMETDAFFWDRDPSEISEVQHHLEMMAENQEHVSPLQNHQSSRTHTSDMNLPETLLDSEINPHLTMAQENESEKSLSKPAIVNPEESRSVSEFIFPESGEIVKGESTKNVSERLAGLSRDERLQLTAIFKEFWGQLFDHFGKPTCDARAMRLNVLLGVDSKLNPESTSVKSECMNKDSTRCLSSAGGRGYEYDLLSSSFYSTMQQHSDQQPATSHGYDLAKEKSSDYKKLQSPPSVESNYIDSYSQQLGQKLRNRPCTMRPPGFHNDPVPRKQFHTAVTALEFKENSPPMVCRDAFSLQLGPGSGASSFWIRQPCEHFGLDNDTTLKTQETASVTDMKAKLLQSFRSFIMELLKLEASVWLFKQDGADEDLIARVATRERFLIEVEGRSMDRNHSSAIKIDGTDLSTIVPVINCGAECVWHVDLIVSFGVWCIHRMLELSLDESRPELWGKYTHVLNLLQGIIDLAFSKPRPSKPNCICLNLPDQQKSSPPVSKVTSPAMLLELIKSIQVAISCCKCRSGTVAGKKGKENLCYVLKRYETRLSRLSSKLR